MRSPRQRRLLCGLLLAALLLVLGGGAVYGERRGWPWLVGPLEQRLSERLGRPLRLQSLSGQPALQLRLWQGPRVQAGRLLIEAAAGAGERPLLEAEGVELRLRYRDLWDWRGEGTLTLALLRARALRADLWRHVDGRASWHLRPFAEPSAGARADATPLLRVERLELEHGRVWLRDEMLQVQARIDFRLDPALRVEASGSYRGKPLQARLDSPAPLPWVAGAQGSLPLTLSLSAGPVRFAFDGRIQGLRELRGLQGRYQLSGPSLAAIGDPLGVTLPSTSSFQAAGSVAREPGHWRAVVERATLGRSRLNGIFVYQDALARPKLSGRLGGSSLWFGDLGPAVGVPVAGAPGRASDGKLLPDRRFDLPSLRTMDADVTVALDRVDLGAAFRQPLAPVQGRLRLEDGVLALQDLDLRAAGGRLQGMLQLDGRAARARWKTDLAWSGVRLEQWLQQGRAAGQPPYVSGRLNGRLQLDGEGRSTAELLASAQGRALLFLPRGELSHLAVEAAGIDLAQGLGVWLRGDDALPLQCAAADLRVRDGRVEPHLLVVDTLDSTLWVDGQLSLASEQLDLRLNSAPKDFSPLALRSPVRIEGSLGHPRLSLEAKPLARRLLPAALLATLNPLAGLLPLMDTGSPTEGQALQQGCQRLLGRAPGKPSPLRARP